MERWTEISYFMPDDHEKSTLIKKMVSRSPVPNIWGQAIKNQIDTLLSMRQQRQMGHFDSSCLEKYPTLSKFWEERSLIKPLQVGTVWPTRINGRLELLFPEGGRCSVYDTSIST